MTNKQGHIGCFEALDSDHSAMSNAVEQSLNPNLNQMTHITDQHT